MHGNNNNNNNNNSSNNNNNNNSSNNNNYNNNNNDDDNNNNVNNDNNYTQVLLFSSAVFGPVSGSAKVQFSTVGGAVVGIPVVKLELGVGSVSINLSKLQVRLMTLRRNPDQWHSNSSI